jgi:hypothetical protein
MLGFDGKPVQPLRGLFSWLAVFCPTHRSRFTELDPLGVVLNGDVAAFSKAERLDLLRALASAAREDWRFRQDAWRSHPFGPLATLDMADVYLAALRKPESDDAHQAFLNCLLDALCHGDCPPSLRQALEDLIEDDSAWFANRYRAYEAWKKSTGRDVGHQVNRLTHWLTTLYSGELNDRDGRLLSIVLTDLYPTHLGPDRVLQYLRHSRVRHMVPTYPRFWIDQLIQKSSPQDLAVLADAWLQTFPATSTQARGHDMAALAGELLAAVLDQSGDVVSDARLVEWLGIGTDEFGFSRLGHESGKRVADWLEARPDRMKAVVSLAYESTKPDRHGQKPYWLARQRLHGAKLPRDWLLWLLEQASVASDEALAKHCFQQAAGAVIDPPIGLDVPTLEETEQWVEAHVSSQPKLRAWLEQAWSVQLDDERQHAHVRELRAKAEDLIQREERMRWLAPELVKLASGTPSDELLQCVALAYDKPASDAKGETPLERVQDFLMSDLATAKAAIASLEPVLKRRDLPEPEAIFKSAMKGYVHPISSAALLAATLHFGPSPASALEWPKALVEKLIAFYFSEGTGRNPEWFQYLCEHKPKWVAPLLLQFVLPGPSPGETRKRQFFVSRLQMMGHEVARPELRRLVLPTLLDRFPLRSNEETRLSLNASLLARLHVLDETKAQRIVRLKLAQPGLDPLQRISWLVADLAYRPAAAGELLALVGQNERRAEAMIDALSQQQSKDTPMAALCPDTARLLIEVLAPIAPIELSDEGGAVRRAHRRGDSVRRILASLTSDPSSSARKALKQLMNSERLGGWRDSVAHGIQTQQSIARESSFQAPSPAAVAAVIANQVPATAADLQALVMWHLQDIEGQFRGANNTSIRLFWHWQAKNGKRIPISPFDENECRDVVQRELVTRLKPLNIHVEREASSVADTRADMRVVFTHSGKTISLPIEVKKEGHSHLWTAWRDQLQLKYTVDPTANGFGLYLVLWFGHTEIHTPAGVLPRTENDGVVVTGAQHLCRLIIDRIPAPERHQIAVHVMDLSWPELTQH